MLIPGADSALFNSTASILGVLADANNKASLWMAVVQSKDIPNNLKVEANKAADDLQQALDGVSRFFNIITSG